MELKEKYQNALIDVWKNDKKMIDYCIKKTSVIREYEEKILAVYKSRIETNFCFGYGWSGISNGEDQQDAYNMAEHAKKDYQYFIDENLKEIDREIKRLNDNRFDIWYNPKYYSQSKDNPLINLEIILYDHFKSDDHLKAPDDMINLYIEMLEEEKKMFTKRLNTYLKRYGLTKIRSWAYLVD